MRNCILFLVLLLALALFCSPAWAINGDMGGTDPNGSEASPYLIEDVNDFDVFASDSSYWASGVHTKLMTDIDLSGRTYSTAVIASDTSTSYGFQGPKFVGVFDGNQFTINSMSIVLPDWDYLGLFGYVDDGARILNLGIKNFSINSSGKSYFGGLVGYSFKGTIDSCHTAGIINIETGYAYGGVIGYNSEGTIMNSHSNIRITGRGSYIGGLIGENSSGTVDSCYATGQITATTYFDYVGGLIGNNEGSIANCFSNCDVSGRYYVGGLVGFNRNGGIQFSSATGDVSGIDDVGGLAGYNADSDILNSYSTGIVNGQEEVGGLVGWTTGGNIENCYSSSNSHGSRDVGGLSGGINSTGSINNCYSNGKVTGDLDVGGFLGKNVFLEGIITECFWDAETSVIGNPGDDNYGATGKTTAEMQTQSTFTGWDFSDSDGDPADWMMLRELEDYPRLAWQEVFASDITGLYGVDMVDFAFLAGQWSEPACNELNNWCQGVDIDHLDGVDIKDLLAVADDWLQGY